MASTSTGYGGNNNSVFDVFINYHGDAKKTLAEDIYNCLCEHGLRVFLNFDELQEGEEITPQIKSAIRTAFVHLPIFSENYAESSLCLNELVLMLESGSTILPIFYSVKPSELRWKVRKDGVYARALIMLEEKNTLKTQSQQERRRYDSDTIAKWRKALSKVAEISGFDLETCNSDEQQLVEQVVVRVLKIVPRRLHVSDYRKGLDEQVKDLDRIVLSQQRSMKSKLLKDQLAEIDVQISSSDEGQENRRSYVSFTHSLIILDDVDHVQQLDALLLPAKDVLHSGSLILVSSRNKDFLTSSGILESSIHWLTGLVPQHSQELFCWHAFGQPHHDLRFEEVTQEFSGACEGLPFSLKVFWGLLRGKKHLNYWKSQLREIFRRLHPDDVISRLKISCDSLDEKEKHIFLDVACFFIGEDRDAAIRIWEGYGWEASLGIQNLKEKCFVKVDSDNQLRMHDLLRDLGRDIAMREPPHRLRHVTDNLIHDLSEKSTVPLQLRDLNVGATLMKVPEFIETLKHLVKIALHENEYMDQVDLETLLDELCHLPNLMHLELKKRKTMKSLPDSFGNIRNLRHIDLSGCSNLQMLPDSFCNLEYLRLIVLSECSNLQMLPESFGNLENLRYIDLSECSNLQMLPDSFGKLKYLWHIVLSKCSNLHMLPDSFGNLENLRYIDLSECSNLQMLPDSFGKLKNLCHIDLSECSNLHMLSDSFGNLENLRHIDLSVCVNLLTFPEGDWTRW